MNARIIKMLTQKEYFDTIDQMYELDPTSDLELIRKLIVLILEYEDKHYTNGIPPDILANALQDNIHEISGKVRAAKSIKVKCGKIYKGKKSK